MDPQLSLIWVHYRTPELLQQSLASALHELQNTAVGYELIVVNNGGLPDQIKLTTKAPLQRLDSERNLGYAGGINTGVAQARGKYLMVLNPDVMLLPGCLSALLSDLKRYDIVAPRLFLDKSRVFELPANERRDFVSAVLRELAQSSKRFAGIARRRWRKHVHAAPHAEHCFELSGAILAFTRQTWDTLGPWNEQYQLFFEETEWLQRAKRQKLATRYSEKARAIHLYAQSTQKEPQQQAWFAESFARFEQQTYSHFQRWLLELIRRWSQRQSAPERAAGYDVGTIDTDGVAYLELSNSRIGFPAAMADLSQHSDKLDSTLRQLHQQLPKANYRLRQVYADGSEGKCVLL